MVTGTLRKRRFLESYFVTWQYRGEPTETVSACAVKANKCAYLVTDRIILNGAKSTRHRPKRSWI